MDFYEASLPHLEELVKVTQQPVHLVIHDNGKALYINKVENPGAVISQPSQIGVRLPMHCTAVGKVLLSGMTTEKVADILAKEGLAKITANTISQPADLHRALEEIREKGYALDDEEIQVGLRCIAAPIKDFNNKIVAAISISGLTAIFTKDLLPFYVKEIKGAAARISVELGYGA
ncbi:MAG: IclR family transcriptional regulator [Firmicutes bacterium]|nr:IclR family transcriptional regulator [Bacillota bacterium]